MEIAESQARDLFVQAGLPADTWTRRRLEGKLEHAVEVISAAHLDRLEEGSDAKRLFLRIAEAEQEGETVTLKREEENVSGETNGEGVVKTKKTKKESRVEKTEKVKKDKAATDRFGSRLGSNRAKLNECLSTKPKTIKELEEEAGVERAPRKHLQNLVDKGIVVKTTEGYALPKKTKVTV